MINIMIFVNILILSFDTVHFLRNPSSIWRLFKFCYSMIIGGGFVFILWMDSVWGYKFKLYDVESVNYYFLYGYLCIWFGYLFSEFMAKSTYDILEKNRRNRPVIYIAGRDLSISYGLKFLCFLSIISAAMYVSTTGLSFGNSSYQSRYEDAAGSGLFLLFIPAFMPYGAYRLIKADSNKSFAAVAIFMILYSCFIFILLKGYRQILIATMLLILIISFKKGVLSRKIIALGFMIFPFLLLAMSFLRYVGEADTPFSDIVTASLYYIQGDLFPADAPLRTYWYCQNNPCPGWDVFSNHLMKFVPRAFYPGKPLIAMDAAGFYTKVIVGYERDLTLSSTILSEALMMKSNLLFSIIMIASGVIASILSRISESVNGSVLYYIVVANSYIGFFWVREGLEDAVNRIIIMSVYFIIVLVSGWTGLALLNPRGLRRRGQI